MYLLWSDCIVQYIVVMRWWWCCTFAEEATRLGTRDFSYLVLLGWQWVSAFETQLCSKNNPSVHQGKTCSMNQTHIPCFSNFLPSFHPILPLNIFKHYLRWWCQHPHSCINILRKSNYLQVPRKYGVLGCSQSYIHPFTRSAYSDRNKNLFTTSLSQTFLPWSPHPDQMRVSLTDPKEGPQYNEPIERESRTTSSKM